MIAHFTITGPPRSWQRRRTGRSSTGKTVSFNDPEYTKHKAAVGWAMHAAVQASDGTRAQWLRVHVSMTVAMFFGSYKVQDADRVLNLILDAGKTIFWKDDTWTTFAGGEIVLRPRLDRDRPRVEVTIESVGEGDYG